MASIFTYDPDPPRVASPWLQDVDGRTDSAHTTPRGAVGTSLLSNGHRKITRLQAEPQEGPVEYKLHLLLRPRRKFQFTSTGIHISGSKHSKFGDRTASQHDAEKLEDVAGIHTAEYPPPASSTQQTRQHRLEQLTTQLLWRLQQSSPHHTSSASNTILPSLPEALEELQAPQQIAKLPHGLEESQGALYEIGVSDDGTLVGLAEDEMLESLNNLRAMAACLGCTVEVLRTETVGECAWVEESTDLSKRYSTRRAGKLVVAEALVKPVLHSKSPLIAPQEATREQSASGVEGAPMMAAQTSQLRVTLTGPTMSGKSTLLGTLTASTLDNGRGKSRLSMLRHRHEITSGVTSSVTQELLGYRAGVDGELDVVNYATENIASWTDIHVSATGSRLVLVSDSAGHPRYRRTTIRGLVGWAPHWTLLCIPANDVKGGVTPTTADLGSSPHSFGAAIADMDLSGAQLDLCLRLGLPLVIVITKLDLASRTGLRESLTKILNALKAAGRKPAILANAPGAVTEEDLQSVAAAVLQSVHTTVAPLKGDPCGTVPIVLTSAVDGTGIANLHALLHELEVPVQPPAQNDATSRQSIFHVEDIYNKPAEASGVIVSGRLASGSISVGDALFVGPFSAHEPNDDSEDSDERSMRKTSLAPPSLPASRSFPGALRSGHLSSHLPLAHPEWRRVSVSSIRNLRLPVHSLDADQVGTIAVSLDSTVSTTDASRAAILSSLRKGMVLASAPPPTTTRTFTARFQRDDLDSLAVGNHVVVYIASLRASARIVSCRAPDSPALSPVGARSAAASKSAAAEISSSSPPPFPLFDEDDENIDEREKEMLRTKVAGVVTASELLVTFHLDSAKAFIALQENVLVMPGGGPGLYYGSERGEKGVAGLDGFVGVVMEVFS